VALARPRAGLRECRESVEGLFRPCTAVSSTVRNAGRQPGDRLEETAPLIDPRLGEPASGRGRLQRVAPFGDLEPGRAHAKRRPTAGLGVDDRRHGLPLSVPNVGPRPVVASACTPRTTHHRTRSTSRGTPARPRARSGQVTYVNSRIAPTPTQRSLSRSTYARAPTPEQLTRTPSLRSVHHTPDPLRISSGARRNLPNRHDARSAPTRVSLRAFGAARCGLEKAPRAFGGGSPKSGYVRSACECRGGWCGVERRYWLSRWQLR
jgi:hypothetical protein